MSELPDRPDLDQLRRQARELLRAATESEPHALARLRAVSERVTLSAAQLAVAREYGFPSWPALRTEAEHRRRMSEPEPAAKPPNRADQGRVRWSLGGASAIKTAAGVLSPGGLVIGPDHARLDVSLMLSQETQGLPPGPAPSRVPGMRFVAALFGQHPAHSELPRFDDIAVADDQGTKYTLSFESGSIPRGEPGQVSEPMELHLSLDPVPARDCGWLELRGQDGSVTRLLPSARPTVRVGQLAPAPGSPAERTDGPAHHLDIAADLPPVDGTTVQLDHLISEPGAWCLYLRATPGWWTYSEDRRRKWAAMSVQAEDNLGSRYLTTFGGSTGHRDYEELALRFRPRLDPLARSLKLTFTGTSEQVAVDLDLAPATKPETG